MDAAYENRRGEINFFIGRVSALDSTISSVVDGLCSLAILIKSPIHLISSNKFTRKLFLNFQELYVYNGQNLMPGYPKPLTSIGLPESVLQIDAAFVWGYNQKIYLFHNDQYWRYSEQDGQVKLRLRVLRESAKIRPYLPNLVSMHSCDESTPMDSYRLSQTIPGTYKCGAVFHQESTELLRGPIVSSYVAFKLLDS